MKKTYAIKRKLGVLRTRVRETYGRVAQNAIERIFEFYRRTVYERTSEDGSVGGEIAGLVMLLVVIVMIVGIMAYLHITVSEIEHWFKNVGLFMSVI